MSSAPIVLVHGFATSSARTWGETGWLDLLADSGRSICPLDLLGHGTAAAPHEPEAYEHLEAELLSRFPDEPVDAVGFSMGARTLLQIAADHPGRIERLVVAGVGANLFSTDSDRGLGIADAIEGRGDPENVEAHHFYQLAEESGADRLALSACMRRPSRPLTREDLAPVTIPVLVVLGDRDFAGPADPLLEALPQARLVTLKGVDHFATPKSFTFIESALDFLDAQPRS